MIISSHHTLFIINLVVDIFVFEQKDFVSIAIIMENTSSKAINVVWLTKRQLGRTSRDSIDRIEEWLPRVLCCVFCIFLLLISLMASRLSSLTRKKKEVLQHSFSLVQQRLFTRIPTVQLSNQRDEKKEAKIYFFFFFKFYCFDGGKKEKKRTCFKSVDIQQ